MAVVDGPLCSFNARKTFGKLLTNFNWKGLHVMRLRVSPTQPRTAAVMNMRIKIKSLGKCSKGFIATSSLMASMKAKTPARKPWNGWWVGVAIKQFIVDNAAWTALTVEYDALGAGVRGEWSDHAGLMGIPHVTLSVGGHASDHPETFPRQISIYCLAKACWYMEVLDENDTAYTDPAGWAEAAVNAFGNRAISA